jgi:hypothetical protein
LAQFRVFKTVQVDSGAAQIPKKDGKCSCNSWMVVPDFLPNGWFADQNEKDEEPPKNVEHSQQTKDELK